MSRLLLLAGLLAVSGPGLAQSAGGPSPSDPTTVTPGGARAEARRAARSGVASYYHASLHGNRTANGERYNHGAMTVAHRSLPFGTLLRVTAPSGRRVLVRVNDRGPFVAGRQLDLSGAAADRLGMRRAGTARVRYEVVDPATLPSRRPAPAPKVRHV